MKHTERNQLGQDPAEQRDIFRHKLFYNDINLRLKNSQSTMKMQKQNSTKKFDSSQSILEQTPYFINMLST